MKDVIYEVYSNEEFNSVLDYLRGNGIDSPNNHLKYTAYTRCAQDSKYYIGCVFGRLYYDHRNLHPTIQLIKGFKQENMTQTPNSKLGNDIPRTFAITGSKSLLKAMEEELVGIGYIDEKLKENTGNFLTTNTPNKKEGYYWNKQNFSELYYWHSTGQADVTFQLPQQWDECLTFCKEQLELWDKPKYSVGDWVVIEDDSDSSIDKKANLTGKNNGYTFKIGCINNSGIEYVRKWVNEDKIDRGYGIAIDQVRLATKEEIEKATKIEAGGHTMEVVNGKFKFGCQYITKEEVETLRKFVGSPLNFKMKVGDDEVNAELLNKILNRL